MLSSEQHFSFNNYLPNIPRINLLIDLSGTIHIGDVACPGAIAALTRIRRAQSQSQVDVRLRFCSNTTKESTSDLSARLRCKAGFTGSASIPAGLITTSLEACKAMCLREKWRPMLLLTPSAQSTFRDIDQSDESQRFFFPNHEILPSQLDVTELSLLKACDTVVIGLAPQLFTSAWLDEAFRVLSSEYTAGKKHLVATHRGAYLILNSSLSDASLVQSALLSSNNGGATFFRPRCVCCFA